MQLTRNFNLKEFHCKDGTDVPYIYLINCYQIACELQKIRDSIGKPIIINSGYRTIQHNREQGGSKNSYHLKGLGVDIHVKDYSPSQLFANIYELFIENKILKKELLVYRTHVHYAIENYLL